MSDKLLVEAIELRAESWSASTFQRRMYVGFATAARLLDRMEDLGVVGPRGRDGRREVLVTPEHAADIVAQLRAAEQDGEVSR